MSQASGSHDLLIVGPGVLGSLVANLWLKQHPAAAVVGQTNTTANHDRLRQLGLQPRVKAHADGTKFPFVVFAAPPHGCADYPAEVAAAAALWDGSGCLLLTSSAAVYRVSDGGPCSEDSPVHPLGVSQRMDRLLRAERAVLEAGGRVARLVGLYHSGRGPHIGFLQQGSVASFRPDYAINLLHYEDAASLCLAVLQGCRTAANSSEAASHGGQQIFVGTDDAPVTVSQMMDAACRCSAVNKAGAVVEFTGGDSLEKGKRMSNKRMRDLLGWAPKYPTFQAFMAAGAQDCFTHEAHAGTAAVSTS